MDHNFALGTAVDYRPLIKDESVNLTLEYEMAVLNFLYNNTITDKIWPLVRTYSDAAHTYKPENIHFFGTQESYEAKVIAKEFKCKNEDAMFDYSNDISDTFNVKFDYNSQPFVGSGDVNIDIYDLVNNAESILSPISKINIKQNTRLIPKYKVNGPIRPYVDEVDFKSNVAIQANNSFYDNHWLYPSPFLWAYDPDFEQSTINWLVSVGSKESQETLSCELKIDFDLVQKE